jgi:hypothetical protein
MGTEFCLWLLFLFPGVIYSFWRMLNRYKGCPVCGSRRLVPLDAPAARACGRGMGLPPVLSCGR